MAALSKCVKKVSQGRQVLRQREVHVNFSSAIGTCETRHAECEYTLVEILPDKSISAPCGKDVPVRVQNRFIGPLEDGGLIPDHLLDQTIFEVPLSLGLGRLVVQRGRVDVVAWDLLPHLLAGQRTLAHDHEDVRQMLCLLLPQSTPDLVCGEREAILGFGLPAPPYTEASRASGSPEGTHPLPAVANTVLNNVAVRIPASRKSADGFPDSAPAFRDPLAEPLVEFGFDPAHGAPAQGDRLGEAPLGKPHIDRAPATGPCGRSHRAAAGTGSVGAYSV